MKSNRTSRFILLSLIAIALAACSSSLNSDGSEPLGSQETSSRQSASGPQDVLTMLSRPVLRAASKDPRIQRDVLLSIEQQAQARVLITFKVTELNAPGALEYGNPARTLAKTAIARVSHALLTHIGALSVHRRFEALNAVAVTIDESAIPKLVSNADVSRVEIDESGTGHLAQALPLSRISAVQKTGLRGAGVTVAILDSGVYGQHPDIAGSLVAEACFCSGHGGCCRDSEGNYGLTQAFGPGSADDDHGHGSNVAGIITSDGNVAPMGGAPDARIVAVKVLDWNNAFQSSSDVLAGLDWIINNRPDVDIINASLGTFKVFNGDCESNGGTWKTLIDTLYANGVLLFSSSGNQGSAEGLPLPACLKHTFSVGAVWSSNIGSAKMLGCTDQTGPDKITCFTNSNEDLDLVAPGAPVTSVGNDGRVSTYHGTSQASPLVAACAALLLQERPMLKPAELEAALKASRVRLKDPKNGLSFPRLDCMQALAIVDGQLRKSECTPECNGRVCGDDGCGGSCGNCAKGKVCSEAGQCEQENHCTSPAWDYSKAYVQGERVTYGGHEYVAAYWTRSQNPAVMSGPKASGQPWSTGTLCGPCVPDCRERSCGTDGCGGTCGTCTQNAICSEAGQCLADAQCESVPRWELGKAYAAGAVVQSAGKRFQCRPWPATQWCGFAGDYEPGMGFAWREAWEELGRCGTQLLLHSPR